MTDYTKLIEALRCKRDDCEGCDLAFFDKDEGWMCRYAAKDDDAADAIDELQDKVVELEEELNDADVAADDNERQIEALEAEVKQAAKRNAELHAELEKWVSAAEMAGLVVRCKECIHFTQSGWCDREFDWFPVDENDFCSMAEKMEVQE